MSDLEAMPDATWHSVLQEVLVQYVTLRTNPKGPAPSAPTRPRKEIIKRDTARKEARDVAAASAAAADGGGDSCGDSGGDGGDGGGGGDSGGDGGDGGGGGDAPGDAAASEHGDEIEPAQPAAAKAAGGAARGRPPGKAGKSAQRPR
jgi:hypothetical protein